jgi:small subunit ribosomal protein S3
MNGRGIKVQVSGRLNGSEIARTEQDKVGKIPLHTLRADIDYGVATAYTIWGTVGVKVWVYKGEVLPDKQRAEMARRAEEADAAAVARRRRREEPTTGQVEALATPVEEAPAEVKN